MSKARGLADLGNVYNDGALSNRNAIINGECQVSQRGDYSTATAYVNGAYHLDRWKMGATRTGTIQHLGRSARFTATGPTATDYIEVVQFVEDWDYYKGKTVTASAYVTSNTANAKLYLYDGVSIKDIASHTGDGTEQHLSTTVTLSAAATELRFIVSVTSVGGGNVSIAAGEYIEFTQAQLEVGDTATPFEHRSYGDELARCQRYYEWGIASGSGYGQITSVFDAGSTSNINFKATKRAVPTMTNMTLSANAYPNNQNQAVPRYEGGYSRQFRYTSENSTTFWNVVTGNGGTTGVVGHQIVWNAEAEL